MFSTVRRFIKTGIAFLMLGLMIGGWLLIRRELFGQFADPHLRSAHLHAIGVGFIMFLILGVALWLFPRAPKDDTRYSPRRINASYWILALSTAVRIVSEIARSYVREDWLAWVVVLSGFGQIAGIALYFWTMWSRIRPVGSALRESQGERF